ncbi:protein of unknown function DUF58 [Geobacter metallireducens RCH3]|nr:protein of unknown function DUF58 [Geobacter metallireducens RCH3]
MVSALLGFMTVSGILGWLNIRYLDVAVRLPDEIYDGQETYVTLMVENRKRLLPSFLLRIGVEEAHADFHLVERSATESGTLAMTFKGRGRKELIQAVVSSPFPINFFIRSTTLPLDARCIVFPRPRPCGPPEGPADARSRGAARSVGRGYEGEMETIADYTGVEPLKLIHWRLSARHENLKVKRLTSLADVPLMIDVAQLPGQSLDERLSCGAWIVNRSIRVNRPVGLITGTKVIGPDTSRLHRLKLLTELALHGSC